MKIKSRHHQVIYLTIADKLRVYPVFYKYLTFNSYIILISKAECLPEGKNPRYVVTSISEEELNAQEIYEESYCLRGEMENRIKEQKLDLNSTRTSTSKIATNQVRLYFSSIAYVLMNKFKENALKSTKLAKARCSTIREILLKIPALIKITLKENRKLKQPNLK